MTVDFAYEVALSLFVRVGFFNIGSTVKAYGKRPTALLLLRRKWCSDFIALISPLSSTGFELANFGSSGKHANY
jgi:hypothetical protein